MKSFDVDWVSEIMFLLVQSRDFSNLTSFVREHLGFDPIISKSWDGVIVIDNRL